MKKISIAFLFIFTLASFCQAESSIKTWKSQSVYLPIYSKLFPTGNENSYVNMAVNVFIRNTDGKRPLQLDYVKYYNSEGKLVKTFLNSPETIPPMASKYFLIETLDKTGGWGANFVIKWKSKKEVSEPIIEALHMGGRGTQGYIFSTKGVAVNEVSIIK